MDAEMGYSEKSYSSFLQSFIRSCNESMQLRAVERGDGYKCEAKYSVYCATHKKILQMQKFNLDMIDIQLLKNLVL